MIFQKDHSECDDMKHLFEEGSKKVGCKRLIGKNIDIKLNFQQMIHSCSCQNMIISLNFGIQCVLLELDDKKQSYEQALRIRNLNDLAFVNKRILREQYGMDGYIHITEDQIDWDTNEPKLPVVLKTPDFVTVF